jgi:DNA-binding response OmpR family regulator
MKVLVVEDDSVINSFLCRGLKESGFLVESVQDGQSALDCLEMIPQINLIILDIMLPKKSGLEVLKEIRGRGNSTPVLILSAKRSIPEKVQGLQDGADDYMEKPFSFTELLARVQVLLRRGQPAKQEVTQLTYFEVSLDLISRKVTRNGTTVELQTKEFGLLEYFMRNPGRVLTKTMILENVYGYNFDTQTNVVDVLVFRLRNKLDKDFDHKFIHTIRGLGYVFKNEP